MILVWLLVIPVAAGILAIFAARWSGAAARWLALFGFAAGLALTLYVFSDAIFSPLPLRERVAEGRVRGASGEQLPLTPDPSPSVGRGENGAPTAEGGRWLVAFDVRWIPSLGIRFHLAMDGLSLLLVALSEFLGLIAVACSWRASC
jgi:NADH-quinone oxidoreductase subunit M